MGWRRRRNSDPRRAVAALVALGPLAVLLFVAVVSSIAAGHVGAAPFRGGPWGWLGDAALALDACAALALSGVPAALRGERRRRSGIADVDGMSGSEFEARLAALFADIGYAVVRTGASGDFGADLVLEGVDGRTVVQAKRYDGAVGIDAVQQVIGATRYYDATRALAVTNSTFTSAATELAAAHDVELLDRAVLVGLLAASPLDADHSPPLSLLAREVAGGAVLALFAAGGLFRLVWWVLRAVVRVPLSLTRARR